jgi:4-carboxymuconolactone decarboxylase
VELVGTAGYYTTLAMTMNTARTPAPGGPFLPPRHPATEDGR